MIYPWHSLSQRSAVEPSLLEGLAWVWATLGRERSSERGSVARSQAGGPDGLWPSDVQVEVAPETVCCTECRTLRFPHVLLTDFFCRQLLDLFKGKRQSPVPLGSVAPRPPRTSPPEVGCGQFRSLGWVPGPGASAGGQKCTHMGQLHGVASRVSEGWPLSEKRGRGRIRPRRNALPCSDRSLPLRDNLSATRCRQG